MGKSSYKPVKYKQLCVMCKIYKRETEFSGFDRAICKDCKKKGRIHYKGNEDWKYD